MNKTLCYLIGTSDEVKRPPEVHTTQLLMKQLNERLLWHNRSREQGLSLDYRLLLKQDLAAINRSLDKRIQHMRTLAPFEYEYYLTLAYMAGSLPLVFVLPSLGLPLCIDSLIRSHRLSRGEPPVGVIGALRERYHRFRSALSFEG